jgi:hypothetical protein
MDPHCVTAEHSDLTFDLTGQGRSTRGSRTKEANIQQKTLVVKTQPSSPTMLPHNHTSAFATTLGRLQLSGLVLTRVLEHSQQLDLTQDALCIRHVVEHVGDLLDGHALTSPIVRSSRHDAIAAFPNDLLWQ